MTDAPTLAAWLLARIAEDEAAARAASTFPDGDRIVAALPTPLFDGLRPGFPARVLARCEADRRIVEIHEARLAYGGDWSECVVCYDPDASSPGDFQMETWPCATLRALASVYADADGFREEWR